MRLAPPALLLALSLCLLTCPAEGQRTPSPEHENLAIWIGDWSYSMGSGSGTMSFEPFGEFFVRADEVTPNGNEVIHVMGYDPEEGVYTWSRFYSSGYSDAAKGWVQDNTWTWVFSEPVGSIRRMTIAVESPENFSFKWERSVEGGPWTQMSEGRTTRVR